MAKIAQANKSPNKDNACEELKIPGISMCSVNAGCFPCYFSYYSGQIFIPVLASLDENQEWRQKKWLKFSFPVPVIMKEQRDKFLKV